MDFENTTPMYEEEVAVEAKTGGKGLGIAALIFSICGFLPCVNLCGLAPVVGFILALVSRAKNGGTFNGPAKAALIIAIIAVVLCIVGGILGGILGFAGGFMGALTESVGDPYYY